MNNSDQSLLSLRTALILLLGVLTGTGAGLLTAASGGVVADGFLTGGAAFAGAVMFFHVIIS